MHYYKAKLQSWMESNTHKFCLNDNLLDKHRK